ncbi:unnamed protein product [Pleuronectes platessa]|uniref:Uncharacterized protein n=1 Tax=Pleuronectes platessa TaxID=8262 RepID=A0A9N7TL44_PLEPL|nr:unnamed protein product [Pleuronectes platessa]
MNNMHLVAKDTDLSQTLVETKNEGAARVPVCEDKSNRLSNGSVLPAAQRERTDHRMAPSSRRKRESERQRASRGRRDVTAMLTMSSCQRRRIPPGSLCKQHTPSLNHTHTLRDVLGSVSLFIPPGLRQLGQSAPSAQSCNKSAFCFVPNKVKNKKIHRLAKCPQVDFWSTRIKENEEEEEEEEEEERDEIKGTTPDSLSMLTPTSRPIGLPNCHLSLGHSAALPGAFLSRSSDPF